MLARLKREMFLESVSKIKAYAIKCDLNPELWVVAPGGGNFLSLEHFHCVYSQPGPFSLKKCDQFEAFFSDILYKSNVSLMLHSARGIAETREYYPEKHSICSAILDRVIPLDQLALDTPLEEQRFSPVILTQEGNIEIPSLGSTLKTSADASIFSSSSASLFPDDARNLSASAGQALRKQQKQSIQINGNKNYNNSRHSCDVLFTKRLTHSPIGIEKKSIIHANEAKRPKQ